jgi:hypothetical protein
MDFFLQQGTDNDYLSVATWDLDEKPYAEAGETPNNWALNDNWRALGQAIIDIHNALALEELADEPSGVGEVLADKSGLWVSSGDNRLHFKDPADVDQIIATIDDINALDPQESVKDFRDFTANEPAAPSVGDRYVNTGTGLSSVTGQSVTANYIYQWNGTNWTEIIPDQGTRLADESTNDMMYYNGASWMNLGAVISHNDTSGLQGGISSEYYHLTASEHTELTNWLDNVVLDTNGAMHFGDDVLLNFGSVDNAEIYWESAQTKLRINSSSFIDIRGSSNYVLITGNETTFNNNNSNVDFFIRKNGGGDAFGYDAGTDDFDINSDIHIPDDTTIFMGSTDDAEIIWKSVSNDLEVIVSSNKIRMDNGQLIFNFLSNDVDFTIYKNTSGRALDYDAGGDYFDIASDIHIPDNTNIYFGDSDDGALYFDGSAMIFEGEVISLINNVASADRGIDCYKTGNVNTIDISTGMSASPVNYNTLSIQSDIVAGTGKIELNCANQDVDVIIYKNTSGVAFKYDAGLDEFTFNSDIDFTDALLMDNFVTGGIPLGESGETSLDVWFSNTSIMGALNELAQLKATGLTGDVYSWATSGTTPYLATTSTSWTPMGSFIFDGTTLKGTPQKIEVIANNQAVTQTDIRVYDVTNSNVICTYTGLTTGSQTIVDLGTLSNLPTGSAIFEVQLQTVGAGSGYLYALHIDY